MYSQTRCRNPPKVYCNVQVQVVSSPNSDFLTDPLYNVFTLPRVFPLMWPFMVNIFLQFDFQYDAISPHKKVHMFLLFCLI